jgi:hypothetical protein
MKIIITGVLALAVGLSSNYAQTLIPKLGISISNVNSDDLDGVDRNMIVGISAGLGFNFKFTEAISVQPELLFIQKGVNHKFGTHDYYEYNEGDSWYQHDTKEDYTQRYNYLELPVLLKCTFAGGKVYLNGGISLSYALGGTYKGTYSYTTDDSGEIYNGKIDSNGKIKFENIPIEYQGEDFYADNRVDLGAQFGGGVIVKDKIVLDVRYGLGFTNLSDDAKSKHRVFQFTVGVPLKLWND